MIRCVEETGADRVVLAFLCAAYDEEELEDGSTRTVMHFHPELAPVKIGVLPPVSYTHLDVYKRQDVIPELTYEEYLNFHRTYYHQSNLSLIHISAV